MSDEPKGVQFVASTAEVLATERTHADRAGLTDGESPRATTLVVHFDRAREDRDEFFRWIAEQFGLPAYFGHNWDALEECWRDLAWLRPVDRVVLVFDVLPLASLPDQQRVLFDLLRPLVEDTAGTSVPTWEVVVAARLRGQFERSWKHADADGSLGS